MFRANRVGKTSRMTTRSMTRTEPAAKNLKGGKDYWERNASRDIGGTSDVILQKNASVNLPRVLPKEKPLRKLKTQLKPTKSRKNPVFSSTLLMYRANRVRNTSKMTTRSMTRAEEVAKQTRAEEAAKSFKVGKDPWETNASRDIRGTSDVILEINAIVTLPRILADEDVDQQTRQLKKEGAQILACVGCHKPLMRQRAHNGTSIVPIQRSSSTNESRAGGSRGRILNSADEIQSLSATGFIWGSGGSSSTHVPVLNGDERCVKCDWPICAVNCSKEFHSKMECDSLKKLGAAAMKERRDRTPISVDAEAGYLLLSILRVLQLKKINSKSFQNFMALKRLNLYADTKPLRQILKTWSWYLKPLRMKPNEDWEILARVIGYRINLREVSENRYDYGVYERKFSAGCQPNTTLTVAGSRLTQTSITQIAEGDLLTVGRREWLLSPAHTRNLHARLLPPHDKFSLINDRVCPCAICSDATPNTVRDTAYGQICRRRPCKGQMIPVVEMTPKKRGQTYLNFGLQCKDCQTSISHFDFKALEQKGWVETISIANKLKKLSSRIKVKKDGLRNHQELERILRAINMSGEDSFSEQDGELRNSYWMEVIQTFNDFCPGRAGDFWSMFLKSHQRIEGVDVVKKLGESQRRLREAKRNAGKLRDTMQHIGEGLLKRSQRLLAINNDSATA